MGPQESFDKRYRIMREVIETLILMVMMFLIIRFALMPSTVDGMSMEPRLHNTEQMLVDKVSYVFHTPARGDVIIFDAPPMPGTTYVKRIVGIPGDVITVNNGAATVNGVALNEFYVAPGHLGAYFTDRHIKNLVVPPNDYFVMGDNRVGSFDSRSWGFVPRKKIFGRVVLIYWPFGQDNDGLLPDVSSVFANVHQPQITSSSLYANGSLRRSDSTALSGRQHW